MIISLEEKIAQAQDVVSDLKNKTTISTEPQAYYDLIKYALDFISTTWGIQIVELGISISNEGNLIYVSDDFRGIAHFESIYDSSIRGEALVRTQRRKVPVKNISETEFRWSLLSGKIFQLPGGENAIHAAVDNGLLDNSIWDSFEKGYRKFCELRKQSDLPQIPVEQWRRLVSVPLYVDSSDVRVFGQVNLSGWLVNNETNTDLQSITDNDEIPENYLAPIANIIFDIAPYIGGMLKVERLQQAYETIAQQRAQHAANEALRRSFLGMAGGTAHHGKGIYGKIRMPVQVALSALEPESLDIALAKTSLDRAMRQVDNGVRFTTSLLDAVQRGSVQMHEPVDMRRLHEKIIESYKHQSPDVKVKVQYIDEMVITGGTSQFESVLDNFFRNSLTALQGRPNPEITIAYKKETIAGIDYLVMEQTDNGKGIKKGMLKDLGAKPFTTTDPARTGSGVGLVFSTVILGTYNGEMHIESEEGKYTKVTVKIPYQQKNDI